MNKEQIAKLYADAQHDLLAGCKAKNMDLQDIIALCQAAERTTSPVSLTDEKIIEAIDRPGFAWENLDAAEQRNLLGSIRALLAGAPAPIQRGHDSDCAVHNAPAMPVGPCNCSLRAWEWAPNVKLADDEVMFFSSIYQTSEGLPVMTDCDEHGAWNVAIIFKRRADGVDYRHPVRIIPVDEPATPPALAGSQVQAAGDARNVALEEAAQLCNKHAQKQSSFHQYAEMYVADYLARAIRELKGQP